MARVRVKICGLTNPADGLIAAASGADALGLVFYAASPRAVSLEAAAAIIAALPPFVTPVALFVNPAPELVREVLARLRIDLLQFHGDEPPELCEAFAKPYIKALRITAADDLAALANSYNKAQGILLDTPHVRLYGGTGTTFDWSLIPAPSKRAFPLIMAGGLNATNVASAIQQVQPYAVDVSGGVERAKGLKDHKLIADFFAAVHSAQ